MSTRPSAPAAGKRHLSVLLMLAWPAILEQLLLTLVRYVDTAMVGVLGANATAAVAINSSPTWLISSILSAIGVGYSVQVAHSIGARDHEHTKQVIRQALLAVIVLGIAITAVCLIISPYLPGWMGAEPEVIPDAISYLQIYLLSLPFQAGSYTFSAILRCMGDTRTPLILNTSANLLNVVLNFFFIYSTRPGSLFGIDFTIPGTGWGVAGAAVATSIATAVTGLGITWTALFGKKEYKVSLRDGLKPDRQIISRALELGIPDRAGTRDCQRRTDCHHPHQRFAGHHRAGCGACRRHRRGLKLYAGRRHLLCGDRPGWPVLWCQRI